MKCFLSSECSICKFHCTRPCGILTNPGQQPPWAAPVLFSTPSRALSPYIQVDCILVDQHWYCISHVTLGFFLFYQLILILTQKPVSIRPLLFLNEYKSDWQLEIQIINVVDYTATGRVWALPLSCAMLLIAGLSVALASPRPLESRSGYCNTGSMRSLYREQWGRRSQLFFWRSLFMSCVKLF